MSEKGPPPLGVVPRGGVGIYFVRYSAGGSLRDVGEQQVAVGQILVCAVALRLARGQGFPGLIELSPGMSPVSDDGDLFSGRGTRHSRPNDQ